MDKPTNPLPTTALSRVWGLAIAAGIATVPIVLALFGAIPDIEAFPAVIALAWGGLVFGGTAFIGANLIGAQFEARVSDETRVSGASVDHVTHVRETGDAEADRWLSRYVFARNLFGGLIVPLAIFMGLIWFA